MYQFYLLYSWINWKNGTKVFWCFSDSFKWIQHKIDFKTVHARSISWPFRHLLSLLNESVTSISISQIIWEFIRKFKRINKINNNTILYTTHSVSRENDDYNLTFDFVLSIIVCTLIFNLYILVPKFVVRNTFFFRVTRNLWQHCFRQSGDEFCFLKIYHSKCKNQA